GWPLLEKPAIDPNCPHRDLWKAPQLPPDLAAELLIAEAHQKSDSCFNPSLFHQPWRLRLFFVATIHAQPLDHLKQPFEHGVWIHRLAYECRLGRFLQARVNCDLIDDVRSNRADLARISCDQSGFANSVHQAWDSFGVLKNSIQGSGGK